MWALLHRRDDGSFVIQRNGYPYHVLENDPLFAEVAAAAEGVHLPPEPQPEPLAPPPLGPVSGRQFKAALALAGFISETEMVSPDLPAAVLPALAGMSPTERIIARATWPNLREVQGTEPLLLLFAAMHSPPLGPTEIEALMATARAIP
jgi:hypothetical protein